MCPHYWACFFQNCGKCGLRLREDGRRDDSEAERLRFMGVDA